MREIKFRAWHIIDSEMLQVSQLWLDPKSHEWGAGILDQSNNFHKIKDIALLQYICFKDKNGKEIYEGDIVKDGDNNIFKIEYEILRNCGDCFNDSGPGFNCRTFTADPAEVLEVIGNIFENENIIFNRRQEVFR